VNFRTAARLHEDTEVAVDLGWIRQDEQAVDRIITRNRAHVSLISTLRPGLLLTNNWTGERIEIEAISGAGARTDLDLRTRLSYRPTGVFGLGVEYLYQEIADLKGGSWLYDMDWLPFPGGALQLQFTLIKDRRSLVGTIRDEARAGARWTINRKTLLDVAYTIIQTGDNPVFRSDIFSAFLEYRF
jgi:hypothetical protein